MRRLVPIIAGLFAVVLAGCITTGGTEPAQPTVSPSTEYHHGEIRRVPSATGCIALTFDDGPHPSLTPRLLSILAEENAVATFFLVGQRVQQWPNIATTIRRAGHEIGNHSWSHAALTRLSTDAVRREIERTDAAIAAASGRRPAIIRLPYHANSARVRSVMDRPVIFWDVDTLDWSNRSPGQIASIVSSYAGSGSIILLHDIHSTTITAVWPVIRALKAHGFQFVTMSRLLSGRPCR